MKAKNDYTRPNPVLSSQFPQETAATVEKIIKLTGKKRTEILQGVVHAGLPIYIAENGLEESIHQDQAA